MTEKRRYDAVAIWLHWLVALLLLAQFATGWVWGFFERGSEPRFYLFRTHITLGSTILALAVARVGWRLTHRAPLLPEGMTRLQRIGAHAGHGLLYLAILVQPALGLLAISGFGKTLGSWPRDAHNLAAKLIIAIVIVHVAAVIWHQLIRRDGLLKRMLPAQFSA